MSLQKVICSHHSSSCFKAATRPSGCQGTVGNDANCCKSFALQTSPGNACLSFVQAVDFLQNFQCVKAELPAMIGLWTFADWYTSFVTLFIAAVPSASIHDLVHSIQSQNGILQFTGEYFKEIQGTVYRFNQHNPLLLLSAENAGKDLSASPLRTTTKTLAPDLAS